MRTNTLSDESAFPIMETEGNVYEQGMTMREWYAGMAMQGILAGRHGCGEATAKEAFRIADAMLEQAAKEPK